MTRKQNETEEEKKSREMVEEIASNIAMLSRQVTALLTGRLNRKAILILLANSTRMTQGQVDTVLDAISNLEKTYLKK